MRFSLAYHTASQFLVFCDIYERDVTQADGTVRQGRGFITCSGHGICERIVPYAVTRDPYLFEAPRLPADRLVVEQNASLQVWGCRCDGGWTGEYCEGKDPDYYAAANVYFLHWLPGTMVAALALYFTIESH